MAFAVAHAVIAQHERILPARAIAWAKARMRNAFAGE
jgi:hypothetical protein